MNTCTGWLRTELQDSGLTLDSQRHGGASNIVGGTKTEQRQAIEQIKVDYPHCALLISF
jgi:hypothetical protein